RYVCVCVFCCTEPAATEIYPLSLHDALPISRRTEGGGQLQPERADPLAQRLEQAQEVLRGAQPVTQIALVTDIARQLGAEAEVLGHALAPAAHGLGGRPGVEGGVALDGIEHAAVVGEKLGRARRLRIQRTAPARL